MKRFGAFIAALVIWTLLSFGWLTFFSSGNVCSILRVVPPASSLATPRPLTQAEIDAQIPLAPPGGYFATLRPLTQAEMDAQIASCQTPRPNQLLVIGAGYFVIAVAGLYVTVRKREISANP